MVVGLQLEGLDLGRGGRGVGAMFYGGSCGGGGRGFGVGVGEGVVLGVVVVVGVEELLVVLAGLHLAAIALFSKGEVEVVALEADPVLVAGLLGGVLAGEGGAGGGGRRLRHLSIFYLSIESNIKDYSKNIHPEQHPRSSKTSELHITSREKIFILCSRASRAFLPRAEAAVFGRWTVPALTTGILSH